MAMKSSCFKIKDILHLNGVFAHVLPCLPVHHPDSSFWKHQIFCTLRVVHFGNSSNHSNHHSPIIWVESRWIPGATWVVVGWLSPQLHSNVLHPKVALPISKAPGMNFVKGQRYTILLFQVPSCCLIFGVWGFGYLLLASSPRYPEIHQCPQLFGFGMAKSWDCVWIFWGLGIPTPASKKCWYSGVPLPNEKTHLQTCRFYLFPHHGSCWIIFRLCHLDATLKFECWNSTSPSVFLSCSGNAHSIPASALARHAGFFSSGKFPRLSEVFSVAGLMAESIKSHHHSHDVTSETYLDTVSSQRETGSFLCSTYQHNMRTLEFHVFLMFLFSIVFVVDFQKS